MKEFIHVSLNKPFENKTGGVERFASYLRTAIPDLEYVSWSDFPHRQNYATEPDYIKAEVLGKWLVDVGIAGDKTTAICDGYWSLGLREGRVGRLISVVHGTYFGRFLRSLVHGWGEVVRIDEIEAQFEAFDDPHTEVVYVSEEARREVQMAGIATGKDAIIYHGIDLRAYRPLPVKPKYWMHGATSNRKGLDILHMLNQHYDFKFTAMDEYSGDPLKKARRLNQAYSLVAPTRHEGNAYLLIEALACGVPLITYETGLALEMDQRCGLFTDDMSPQAFWCMIQRFGFRDNYAPREWAEEHCSLAGFIEDWTQYIDNPDRYQTEVSSRPVQSSDERILIEIPTKDRDTILGKHMAALMGQTHQNFDVLILNDGDQEVGSNDTTGWLLPFFKHNRQVWIEEGSRLSQAHNHNIPLYDSRFRDYRYYIRADDDVLINCRGVERMVQSIQETRAGAVGGLWMEGEDLGHIQDRKIFWTEEEFRNDPSINGKAMEVNSNWQHRVYHPTDAFMPVEHLYSVAIVDMEKMRKAGGWPEVYSKGVAHCEETDGTHRLFLSGEQLLIDPLVTGQHLRAPGGIRSVKNRSQIQQMDLMKWQRRLSRFGQVDWDNFTVAIECAHSYGFGGAERQFYHTVALLQDALGVDRVHAVFCGQRMTPEEAGHAFGFLYHYVSPDELYDEYDVLIQMGHEPPTQVVQAAHKILYTFFPIKDVDKQLLRTFDYISGNSVYTCKHAEEYWGFRAKHIYPPVDMIGMIPPMGRCDIGGGNEFVYIPGVEVKKENIILVVSRCVPNKAPDFLIEQFVEMGLEGWELHLISATSIEAFDTYQEGVERLVAEYDNVFMHRDVSDEELKSLYRRAKIMWGATGLRGSLPQQAEHFGYTPVEAWSAGCVPIMYDRGGHQETTSQMFRWKTKEDLATETLLAIDLDWESFGAPCWKEQFVTGGFSNTASSGPCPVDLEKFTVEEYVFQWLNLIQRVNSMALELDEIERIVVQEGPIQVALIADSPYLPEYNHGITTGFGMVSRMITKAIVEQDDMELAVFGLYDQEMPKRGSNLPFDFYPSIGDPGGSQRVPIFVTWANPDVIFILHAPGEVRGWAEQLRTLGVDKPIVAYFPVEGAHRPNAAIAPLFRAVNIPITYCNAGKELIQVIDPDKEIHVARHGLDHAPFEPMDAKERERLRNLVGWNGKMVCTTVATNKRVKNFPVLIRAMEILLQRGYEDILFYFHTKAWDHYTLQGHALDNILELDQVVTGLPMPQHILMPANYNKWRGVFYESDNFQAWKYSKPGDSRMRGAMFNALDLRTRYGMSDLYLDVSSAEGFGFGPLEAAVCGVPFVTVNDQMARTEIHSRYAWHILDPVYWDTWHTGTELAMVSPEQVADAVIEFYETVWKPGLWDYADVSDSGLSATVRRDLTWKPAQDLFVELIRRAHALPSGT